MKNNIVKIIIGLVVMILIGVGIVFGLQKILYPKVNLDLSNALNIDQNIDMTSKVLADETVVPSDWNVSMPIFMYHFILEDYGNFPDTENFLKPETLEEQLKYITENGYQTVFVNEFDRLYKYEKPVCLTFDDCFVYFYNNAYPLLKKYNQKATIYIITDYINGENYLTDEQIKEMSESGLIEIASHTCSHSYLNEMTYEEQLHELRDSQKILEDIIGKKVTTVAYPTGYNDNSTVKISEEYYEFGLEMLGGVYNSLQSKGKYNIPRIYANRTMPLTTFANYCSQSKVVIN